MEFVCPVRLAAMNWVGGMLPREDSRELGVRASGRCPASSAPSKSKKVESSLVEVN